MRQKRHALIIIFTVVFQLKVLGGLQGAGARCYRTVICRVAPLLMTVRVIFSVISPATDLLKSEIGKYSTY